MAIATSLEIDNVAKTIVSGKAPIRATSALEWGCDCPLGVLSSNVTLTLPSINYTNDGFNGEITITAFQPSNGSYTITIQTAAASQTITDGDTNTTSIVYTPTASNNIEINIKPVAVNQASALSVEREGTPPPITLLNQPVGGRIFYVNNAGLGVYTFYDSSHNVLSTQTVAGLANAVTYDYVGPAPGLDKVDKFFVYDINGLFTGTWGPDNSDITGVTANTIGSGKLNTNIIFTTYSSIVSGRLWGTIQTKRNNLVGNCNDWYVGSPAEQDQLRASGLVNWFSNSNIWSSCVNENARYSTRWNYSTSAWVGTLKTSDLNVVAIRSF